MPLISELTAKLKKFALNNPDDSAQLDKLWEKLGVAKNETIHPDDMVDTTYTGDGPAVTEFVQWFRTAVQNQKTSDKTNDRGRAFDILEKDLLKNLTPGAFPKIDPVKFAFQLALRIREPKLINQAATNLCGPNSLVIQMAHERPSQYATLAVQLFRTGTGFIDKLEVEPGFLVRNGYDPLALGECDYVVLGSVRNSAAILLGDNLVRTIGLLTKPGVLCDWLRRAGYTTVEDHTFFEVPTYAKPIAAMTGGDLHGPRPTGFAAPTAGPDKVANLRLMAAKLNAGYKVIMNAEGDLYNQLIGTGVTNSGLAGPSNAMATHWTYVTRITLSPTLITEIKLYTWGGSIKKTNIRIANFASRYAGFVSYRD